MSKVFGSEFCALSSYLLQVQGLLLGAFLLTIPNPPIESLTPALQLIAFISLLHFLKIHIHFSHFIDFIIFSFFFFHMFPFLSLGHFVGHPLAHASIVTCQSHTTIVYWQCAGLELPTLRLQDQDTNHYTILSPLRGKTPSVCHEIVCGLSLYL